jgi:hypothetical protein
LEAIRQISLKGPGINGFAALLPHPTEVDPIGALRWNSHLLLELDLRPTQQILPGINFTFGDCPNIIIPVMKKRSTGVSEQYFQLIAPPPKH